jgi:glycosyltransferase involved in cell wall biosynthesis
LNKQTGVEPAATFIVLSYNQENSIEASVESVLGQVCEPIEIIFSDDASTDGTFDKIEALAKEYSGPHRVIARCNDVNLGTNLHIERAIGLSSSDLMIWGAGDDIYAPDRAQSIIDAYRQTSALLIFSDAQTITSDGTPGQNGYKRALFYRDYTLEEAASSFVLYLGATAAWHKELYRKYGGLPADGAFEDLILGFRAAMEQRIHYIPKKLVTYQEGVGISSNLTQRVSKLSNQERRIAILRNRILVLRQRMADAEVFGLEKNHPVRLLLKNQIRFFEMRLSYYTRDGAARRACFTHPLRYLHAYLSEWLRDIRKR